MKEDSNNGEKNESTTTARSNSLLLEKEQQQQQQQLPPPESFFVFVVGHCEGECKRSHRIESNQIESMRVIYLFCSCACYKSSSANQSIN